MKGKIKKVSTAIALISIGVIVGIAMPIVVKGENGEATSAQVLKGKTFTSSLVGIAKEGAIEDFSKSIITKSVNATNDNFIETIELTPGYYDQIQVNTENVYNAGVAAGQSSKTYTYLSSNWNAHGDGRYITSFSANCDVGDLVIFAFGGTSWGTSVSVSGGTLVKNDFKNMNGNSTYAVELVVVRATSTTVSISGPQLPCGGVIISKIH